MDLPDGIEQEILDYLHLEYGEDRNDPSCLKLEEIKYDGLYDIAGIPTHYFKYGERSWATIEPFGDSYAIGMTSKTPTPITKGELYKSLRISFSDNSPALHIAFESWGDGCFGFSNYKEVTLPDNTTIEVLVQLALRHAPIAVTLGIREGENRIYIRGSVGLTMSYKTQSCDTIFLTVGTGPWE